MSVDKKMERVDKAGIDLAGIFCTMLITVGVEIAPKVRAVLETRMKNELRRGIMGMTISLMAGKPTGATEADTMKHFDESALKISEACNKFITEDMEKAGVTMTDAVKEEVKKVSDMMPVASGILMISLGGKD